MYRPTVRYDDVYHDYVNQVFKVTSLDRNQIIRLALFTAAHTQEFKQKLQKYKKSDVPTPLPQPEWSLSTDQWWMEQSPKEKGGKDVNDGLPKATQTRIDARTHGIERKERTTIPTQQGRVGPVRTEGRPGSDDVIRINFR